MSLENSPCTTGSIGEELATETVLTGAWGFVLKSNLDKLIGVMKNCLERAKDESQIPDHIHALLPASRRIMKQIEANNEILEKVRAFFPDPSPDKSLQAQLKAEITEARTKLELMQKQLEE